jgi:hypothetical protein
VDPVEEAPPPDVEVAAGVVEVGGGAAVVDAEAGSFLSPAGALVDSPIGGFILSE